MFTKKSKTVLNNAVTAVLLLASTITSANMSGLKLFVASWWGAGNPVVIDTSTDTVLGQIDIHTLDTGGNKMEFSPDGSKLYVLGYNASTTQFSLIEVDPLNYANIRYVNLPNYWYGYGLSISKNGKAFISGENNNTGYVTVVDLKAMSILTTFALGYSGRDMALSADGSKVYMTHEAWGQPLSVIDVSTYAVNTISLGGDRHHGIAVHPDGTKIYVVSETLNNLLVIDTATGNVIATINVGSVPYEPAITSDGKKLYVPNQQSNSVSIIDTTTNTVMKTLSLSCQGPLFTAISPDNTKVYVSCSTSVAVIDGVTDTQTTTINGINKPFGMAFHQDVTVGGLVTNTGLQNVICKNITTGQSITIKRLKGSASWDCTAAGLQTKKGDIVKETLTGTIK